MNSSKQTLLGKVRALILDQPNLNDLCETVNNISGEEVVWIDREDLLLALSELEKAELLSEEN